MRLEQLGQHHDELVDIQVPEAFRSSHERLQDLHNHGAHLKNAQISLRLYRGCSSVISTSIVVLRHESVRRRGA